MGINRKILLLILFLSSNLWAAQENWDQEILVQRVVLTKVIDNVDGAYSARVRKTVELYLNSKQRLSLIPSSEDTTQYQQMNVDTLIEVVLMGLKDKGRIEIKFISYPKQTLLFFEQVDLDQFEDIGFIETKTIDALESIFKTIPYDGTVVSRNGKEVLVKVDNPDSLKPLQEMEVYRIDEPVFHPLLGTVVDLKYVPVGKLQVVSSDSVLAFTTTAEEKEEIKAGEKVLVKPATTSAKMLKKELEGSRIEQAFQGNTKFLNVDLLGGFGSFKSEMTQPTGGLLGNDYRGYKDGSVVSYRADVEGLINRKFTAELFYANSGIGFDDNYSNPKTERKGKFKRFEFNVGYRFTEFRFLNSLQMIGGIGYSVKSFDVNENKGQYLVPVSAKGVNVFLKSWIPINKSFYSTVRLTGVFFNSFKEDPELLSGEYDADKNFSFEVGAGYFYAPRLKFLANLEYQYLSGESTKKIVKDFKTETLWLGAELSY